MKFSKFLCVLLAAALLLVGCANTAPTRITETEEATEPSPSDPQEQLKLLMHTVDTWKAEDFGGSEVYYYAVTDLDWNGRLEIIAASTQGTGIFTYGTMYEVSEDFSSVVKCDTPCDHNTDLPEITVESTPAAYDAESGCYDYLFTNDTRNGAAEHYQSIVALRLQNGVLSSTVLANSFDRWIDEGQEEHEYAAPSGDGFLQISAADYAATAANYQADRLGFTACFQWITFEEITLETLAKSWDTFQAVRNG